MLVCVFDGYGVSHGTDRLVATFGDRVVLVASDHHTPLKSEEPQMWSVKRTDNGRSDSYFVRGTGFTVNAPCSTVNVWTPLPGCR